MGTLPPMHCSSPHPDPGAAGPALCRFMQPASRLPGPGHGAFQYYRIDASGSCAPWSPPHPHHWHDLLQVDAARIRPGINCRGLFPAAGRPALPSGRLTAAALCTVVAALQPEGTILVDESLTSGGAYFPASQVGADAGGAQGGGRGVGRDQAVMRQRDPPRPAPGVPHARTLAPRLPVAGLPTLQPPHADGWRHWQRAAAGPGRGGGLPWPARHQPAGGWQRHVHTAGPLGWLAAVLHLGAYFE